MVADIGRCAGRVVHRAEARGRLRERSQLTKQSRAAAGRLRRLPLGAPCLRGLLMMRVLRFDRVRLWVELVRRGMRRGALRRRRRRRLKRLGGLRVWLPMGGRLRRPRRVLRLRRMLHDGLRLCGILVVVVRPAPGRRRL